MGGHRPAGQQSKPWFRRGLLWIIGLPHHLVGVLNWLAGSKKPFSAQDGCRQSVLQILADLDLQPLNSLQSQKSRDRFPDTGFRY